MSVKNLFGLIKNKKENQKIPKNISIDFTPTYNINNDILNQSIQSLHNNQKLQRSKLKPVIDIGELQITNIEQNQPAITSDQKLVPKYHHNKNQNASVTLVPINRNETSRKPKNFSDQTAYEDIMMINYNLSQNAKLAKSLLNIDPQEYLSYTVKHGDTLTNIAKANNLTLKELIELNHLKNNDIIIEGDILRVSKPNKFSGKNNQPLINRNNSNGGGSFGGGHTGGGGASGGWEDSNWKEQELNNSNLALIQMSFNDAFAAARKRGDKTFTWNGKLYGTELAKKENADKLKGKGQTIGTVAIPQKKWTGIKIKNN